MFLFRFLITTLVFSSMFSLPARAASISVVISELQTGSSSSGSQEFVELYNPTELAIAVDGWKLQYQSASPSDPSSWTTKATLSGSIASHGFLLLAPKTYLSQADISLTSGLSGTGGHIRLINTAGIQIDLVGWGTATRAETAPFTAPAAGQSIERLAGRLVEDGGNGNDTDDNSKDFVLRAEPVPQSSASPTEAPYAGVLPTDSETETDDDAPAAQVYASLVINELLPDPASPQTDAKDEYIEVFNPTSQAVILKGYSLHVGRKFYLFTDQTIPAGGYITVYSAITRLALVNAGSTVTLQDPAGTKLDETSYDDASTGVAWARLDSGWDWSASPTPTAINRAQAVGEATSPSSKPTAKATTVKAVAAKAVKTAKAKTAKAVSPKTEEALNSAAQAVDSPLARWLLIGLASFTIIYAIYEYRHDLRNYIQLARRYFQARRTAR